MHHQQNHPVVVVIAQMQQALGKMYVFTLKDGNNIHVAIGHGRQETKETWRYHLEPLFDQIITPNSMSIISDEHVSICPAIALCDAMFT